MALRAEAIGLTIESPPWLISARRALAFSAIIAPDDASLFEDEKEGFEALPTIIVAPEWAAALALRDDDRLGVSSSEQLRAVHAGQDTRFFAPLRVGRSLTTSGQISAVRATAAGALMEVRYVSVDSDSGEKIAETISHSIYRDVAVEGASSAADIRAEPIAVEFDRAGALALPLGFAQLYSEAAEIWNPIHTERRAALSAGLPGCIVHGTALWALAGYRISRSRVDASLRVSRLSCRFSNAVPAGAGINIRFGAGGGSTRFEVDAAGRVCIRQGVVEFSA